MNLVKDEGEYVPSNGGGVEDAQVSLSGLGGANGQEEQKIEDY